MADGEQTAIIAAGKIRPGSTVPKGTGAFRGLSFTAVENRGLVALVALVAGCTFIVLGSLVLQTGSFWAVFLFEKTAHSTFPFTIQNLIHLIFFVGLGELFVRWRTGRRESALLDRGYLPEDEASVLTIEDLGEIRREVAEASARESGYLPNLIKLLAVQLQANRSVDQAVGVLTSSLELQAHKVELRYAMIRYIVWIIPTMGFVGTVSHLASALRLIDGANLDLGTVTTALGQAFNATTLALLESAILVLLQHIVSAREEEAVSRSGEYCLQNLVNRIYLGPADE